jgi:hypothetical protein
MSIKRILVPLPASIDHTGEVETALTAAKALGAHIEALFISQPPPPTPWGPASAKWATEQERRPSLVADNFRFATECRCGRIDVILRPYFRSVAPCGLFR